MAAATRPMSRLVTHGCELRPNTSFKWPSRRLVSNARPPCCKKRKTWGSLLRKVRLPRFDDSLRRGYLGNLAADAAIASFYDISCDVSVRRRKLESVP